MINLIVSCFASFILAVMYLKEPGNDYNSAIVNYYGSKLKVFFHIFFYSFIIFPDIMLRLVLDYTIKPHHKHK